MSDGYTPKPNDVLRPVRMAKSADFPQEALLVLDARSAGRVSVVEIGNKPRSPRWMSVERIRMFVREGALAVEKFVAPASALLPVDALTPAALSEFNDRKAAMAALLQSRDAQLLAYPDEFAGLCRRYADANGYKRKWVEKNAWMWLKNGRTESALVGNRANCGGPGKKRTFTHGVVGGGKQADGEDFRVLEASPYSRADRTKLQVVAERIWRMKRKRLTHNQFWLQLRREAARLNLAPPSPAQAAYFLKDYKERRRKQQTTGLLHQRYRGRPWATKDSEVDSTQLQAFTRSELDEHARLKNPVMYKLIEVKWQYVAAVYVTYDWPSPAVLAEVIYRAMAGMVEICKELGLKHTECDFPRLPPTNDLWADNQELTSPQLNNALLRHLGIHVHLTIVAKGADKGKIEGSIGKDKAALKGRDGFFEKHTVGKALEKARKGTDLDIRLLEAEIIRLAYETNHRELPVSKVPKDFLKTGRPCNRLELFKWDMQRTPELIKPLPPKEALAKIILPTRSYPVHAGQGVYIDGRYYISPELIGSGLLRKHARGDTPRVEVAEHRGTTMFVEWVRGPNDFVRCILHGGQQDVFGDMTVSEAEDHMRALPAQKKREQQRLVNTVAHENRPRTRHDRKMSSESAKKGHVTRDKQRIAATRKAEAQLGAKRDAHRRWPKDVPAPTIPKPATTAPKVDMFADMQAGEVEKLIEERRRSQS